MGCLPETLCGHDIDDVFAYSTPKYVAIRDRRVGIMHKFILILITIYIVLMQMAVGGNGLISNTPSGHVEYDVQHPLFGNATENCEGNQTGYGESPPSYCAKFCDVTEDWCKPAFPLATKMSYCRESGLPYGGTRPTATATLSEPEPYSGVAFPCAFLAANQVALMSTSGPTVATAIKRQGQASLCSTVAGMMDQQPEQPSSIRTEAINDTSGGYCPLLWTGVKIASDTNGSHLYAVGVEKFYLLMDHLFDVDLKGLAVHKRSSDACQSSDCRTACLNRCKTRSSVSCEDACYNREAPLPTLHVPRNGTASDLACQRYGFPSAPCDIPVSRVPHGPMQGKDYIPLEDVLAAAGAALDENNHIGTDVPLRGSWLRRSGGVIMITVRWQNWNMGTGPFSPGGNWFHLPGGWSHLPEEEWDAWYSYEAVFFTDNYKTSVVRWLPTENASSGVGREREIEQRDSIRIVLMFTGTIHGFHLPSFLTSLAGALTLLALANTIVDVIAVNFLLDSRIYKAYKYEYTQDFSKLRTQLDQALDEQEQQSPTPRQSDVNLSGAESAGALQLGGSSGLGGAINRLLGREEKRKNDKGGPLAFTDIVSRTEARKMMIDKAADIIKEEQIVRITADQIVAALGGSDKYQQTPVMATAPPVGTVEPAPCAPDATQKRCWDDMEVEDPGAANGATRALRDAALPEDRRPSTPPPPPRQLM